MKKKENLRQNKSLFKKKSKLEIVKPMPQIQVKEIDMTMEDNTVESRVYITKELQEFELPVLIFNSPVYPAPEIYTKMFARVMQILEEEKYQGKDYYTIVLTENVKTRPNSESRAIMKKALSDERFKTPKVIYVTTGKNIFVNQLTKFVVNRTKIDSKIYIVKNMEEVLKHKQKSEE